MIDVLKKALNTFKFFIEFIKFKTARFFVRNWNKDTKVYLISERGTDARDNGYHFFKYICENFPDKEVYYVIDIKSADYQKVKRIGNVVKYRSWKHYKLFAAPTIKISTHIMGYSPSIHFFIKYHRKKKLPGKHIFLQHGITQNNPVGLYAEKCNLDVFICGAEPEYKYVCENFHYKNNEVKHTGLARYDALHDCGIKEQILVMPTWRIYIKGLSPQQLSESVYIKAWNALLNDKRLIECLQKAGIKLVFYPHYEMQPFLNLFSTTNADVVEIADFAHYDVQQLLKESMLLITDYSSVFFDFAYMKKPMIYYQFDQSEFFEKHYQKGYFDYYEDGFGPVVMASNDLIEEIIRIIQEGVYMDSKYLERSQKFFPLYDKNNCARIFNEIQKLL